MTVTMQVSADYFHNVTLTPQQIAHYRRQGYVLIDRTLTPRGLEAMRDACMQAWRKEKGEFDPDKNWLQNALLVNIHHQSKLVADFYLRGPLVKVATQLIGPNVKAAASQLTFKMRGNDKPFGWHQDNGYGELDPYNAISTLTALDDADKDNGCLWLLPQSHLQGQARAAADQTPHDKAAFREIVLEVNDDDAAPVPMKAGQTLVFHCWMLHKSQGNLSPDRDRRILFMRYADADAVEVYNDRRPRLGRLVAGETRYPQVAAYEAEL